MPTGVADVVFTVTVTGTGTPGAGVTAEDGAKLQVMPVAGALQETSTTALNIPAEATVDVKGAFAPGVTLRLEGDGAPRVKSATFTVIGSWCVTLFESLPTACKVNE